MSTLPLDHVLSISQLESTPAPGTPRDTELTVGNAFDDHLHRSEHNPDDDEKPTLTSAPPAPANREETAEQEKRETERTGAAEEAKGASEMASEENGSASEEPITEGERAGHEQRKTTGANLEQTGTLEAEITITPAEGAPETPASGRSASDSAAPIELEPDAVEKPVLDQAMTAEQEPIVWHERVIDEAQQPANHPSAKPLPNPAEAIPVPPTPTDDVDGGSLANARHESNTRADSPQTDSTTYAKSTTVELVRDIVSDDAAVRSDTLPKAAHPGGPSSADTSDADSARPTPTGNSEHAPPASNRLTSHLISGGPARHSDTPNVVGVDQARFIQRVARAFETAQNRNGPIRLRLSPPELGSLRLEVKLEGQVMVARIETETTTARSILADNLTALKDRLAQQDIKVEQFDVDLMDRQPGGMSDRPAENTDLDHQADRRPSASSDRNDEPETTNDAPPASGQLLDDGRLNVVV